MLKYKRKISRLKPLQKYSYALVCALLLTAFSSEEFRLIHTLPFTDAKMTTDRLGNAYVIVENQLLQFDSLGKPKANYAEPNAGLLTSVDAGNPLKVMLFYRDFAQLQILNNKLSKESVVDLRNLGILQPVAACQSYLDGYWIFDLQDFSLKKIDNSLKIIYQSSNMNQTLGYSLLPESMVEANDFVYVNNPETGILVFDKYGSYYKTIPIPAITNFQIIEKNLLYVIENKVRRFNLSTLDDSEVILPPCEKLVSARFEQKKLYLLTNVALTFYSY